MPDSDAQSQPGSISYDPGTTLTPVDYNPFAAGGLSASDPFGSTPLDPDRDKLGFSTDQTLQAYNPSWGDRLKWGLSDVLTSAGMRPNLAQDYGERGLSAAQLTPGLGQALAGNEAYRDYQAGDYVGAGLNAVGALPDVGTMAHGLGSLAIFAGPMARTADKAALETATKMAAEGADKRSIWDATGWFTGADGKWRFEIPDNNVPTKMRGTENELFQYPNVMSMTPHADLQKAYPFVSDIRLAPELGPNFGMWDAGQNAIWLRPTDPSDFTGTGPTQAKSTILHELQHAVQDKEGFGRGFDGSKLTQGQLEDYLTQKHNNEINSLLEQYPEAASVYREKNRYVLGLQNKYGEKFGSKATEDEMSHLGDIDERLFNAPGGEDLDDASRRRSGALANAQAPDALKLWQINQYHNTAGEVEARNVQTRMNMTPEQRQASPPWETQDVPTDQQIVRGNDGKSYAMSAVDGDPFAPAKAFTKKEIAQAAANYGGGHAIAANILLRQGPEELAGQYAAYGKRYPAQVQKTIDALDQMATPRESDTTLFRSMPIDTNLKPGDVVHDPGFMSTSSNSGTPEYLANDRGEHLVTINAPQGSNAIDLNKTWGAGERNEVVLPRGSRLQLTSVDHANKRAEATLLPPGGGNGPQMSIEPDQRAYPIAPRSDWYGEANYETNGGKLVQMSPDEFLSKSRPLEIDESSRDNIDDLKNHIQSGRTLDPLSLYANGKEDGRHRAYAAKELGIQSVPVIDFRGGSPDQPGIAAYHGSPFVHPTETPEFKNWFGESKAIDESGKPLLMYHGTQGDIDQFDKDRVGQNYAGYSLGLHFTNSPSEASVYAGGEGGTRNHAVGWNPDAKFGAPLPEGANVMPVYLKAENPLHLDTDEVAASMKADFDRGEIARKVVESRRAGNPYDSVIITAKNGNKNIIVFDPKQIKSAIGNNGKFDPNNSNIKYGIAGALGLGGVEAMRQPGEDPTQYKLTPVSHNPFSM